MDLRAEGIVTLVSSCSHGGDHAGTVQYLRREKIVQPDGQVVDVPVIAGNAIRGILRDHSAALTWQWLGEPSLPLPVFDFLWSGGALAKAGAGHVLRTDQLRRLRELVPHVGLFGGAGGGRIIEGHLQVGKLVPLVREIAGLLPHGVDGGDLPSVWDVVQIEEFSRRDDLKRPQLAAHVHAGPTVEQGDLLSAAEPPAGEIERDVAQQMRYGVETIAAGTRLWWWLAVRGANDLEVAQLRATLASWAASGAHMGGRAATGHGRLRAVLDGWVNATPELTVGGDAQLPDAALPAHFEACRAEAVDLLVDAIR